MHYSTLQAIKRLRDDLWGFRIALQLCHVHHDSL
jgi:hypothetical protein